MKRLILVLLFCGFAFFDLKGQEIRLGLYDGKTFGRPVDNYHYAAEHYQGLIKGAWRQGVGIACFLDNAFDIGLLYYHQDTKVPTTFYTASGTFDKEFDMTIQWFLVDFAAYIGKSAVKPFLGTNIGAGIFTLKDLPNGDKSSRLKFTWGGNVGIEYSFPKLISIRLKGDLLYSVKFTSPSSSGTSTNITAFNSYLQTAISVGIIFRYKLKKKKN